MTADSEESRELQNLKLLEEHSPGNLSAYYIVQLLDSFTHTGPNGLHQCLVFELLGPSVDKVLADYHEGRDKLDPEIILRMSTQLLEAVKFIHRAGMCHGGKITFPSELRVDSCTYLILDISGRNLAFSCTHLSDATEEQLFEVIGSPEIEPLVRIDGMPLENGLPTQLVKAAEWVDWIDEDDEDIRLFDLRESFLHGKEPAKLAQPGTLRVPETIFTNSFDYRVDLWRIGCMVCECHISTRGKSAKQGELQIYSFLFTSFPFWYLGEDEVLVFQMIGFVERLPAEWEAQWRAMQTRSQHDLSVEGEQLHVHCRFNC